MYSRCRTPPEENPRDPNAVVTLGILDTDGKHIRGRCDQTSEAPIAAPPGRPATFEFGQSVGAGRRAGAWQVNFKTDIIPVGVDDARRPHYQSDRPPSFDLPSAACSSELLVSALGMGDDIERLQPRVLALSVEPPLSSSLSRFAGFGSEGKSLAFKGHLWRLLLQNQAKPKSSPRELHHWVRRTYSTWTLRALLQEQPFFRALKTRALLGQLDPRA